MNAPQYLIPLACSVLSGPVPEAMTFSVAFDPDGLSVYRRQLRAPTTRLMSVLDNYSTSNRWTRLGPRAFKPGAFLDLRTAAFGQAFWTCE